MSSGNFFAKVQTIATKTRIMSRSSDREQHLNVALFDDDFDEEHDAIDTETISAANTVKNYHTNYTAQDRSFVAPKRTTNRRSRTQKRTFGYQLPIDFDNENRNTKTARRLPSNVHYRRNRTLQRKTHCIYYDAVKR